MARTGKAPVALTLLKGPISAPQLVKLFEKLSGRAATADEQAQAEQRLAAPSSTPRFPPAPTSRPASVPPLAVRQLDPVLVASAAAEFGLTLAEAEEELLKHGA